MAYSVEIGDRAGVLRGGLFYLSDVASFLTAADRRYRGSEIQLGPPRLSGWSRRGFFRIDTNEYERNKRFTDWGGLITCRMIALLASYGIRIDRIRDAHEYLQETTGLEYPFTSRRFWSESQDASSEVYAELDRLVVTASRFGQLPFTGVLNGPIGKVNDMEFDSSDDELVVMWQPSPGVVIRPGFQTGAPCIAGTRTPTWALYGSYVAGDSVEDIAFCYRLRQDQVRTAIDWEERLTKA